MTKKTHPIFQRAAAPLPPEKLRNRLDPATLPYQDSQSVPKKNGQGVFQPRAMQALRMALMIPGLEYNVFVAGDPGQGRTHIVRQYL